MKKLLAATLLTFAMAGSAFAQTTPPTLPDGPVASPPGWSCTASGGVVTCVRTRAPTQQN